MATLADPPLARLVEELRDRLGIDVLIETGTFEGHSTLWAAERFRLVFTIEIDGRAQILARERCADHRNVRFLLGDTRICLPFVVSALEGPALFWLDAHAAPGLFGIVDDWPVLEELAVIEQSEFHHVVLIDDAHCFMSETPHPACPTLNAVEEWARASGYDCAVKGDVIVLTPVT